MVHGDGEEQERFRQLSLDYMSEESSSDEVHITVHKPEWRSEGEYLIFVAVSFMSNTIYSPEQVFAGAG